MVSTHTAVLDTNILLLLLVARVDISLLRNFKRVAQFTVEDVSALDTLLQSFQEVATTPHILSETDNFIDQAPSYRRGDLKAALTLFIDGSPERYTPAKDLVRSQAFIKLGISDCGLMDFPNNACIVTTDFPLVGQIRKHGGSAINFREYTATLI